MRGAESADSHWKKLLSRNGGFYHLLEFPAQIPPSPPFASWDVYYLGEKSGSRNPTLSPLKCAQVTLDLLYNSLILGSQTLELASNQEAPDAGLVWRTRGKKPLITAEMEAPDSKTRPGLGEVGDSRASKENVGLDPFFDLRPFLPFP